MIERLPEGKSIGWMQAPPQWIFTHTVRFIGIVRIVIQDGEGFILIHKGKPLAYYFKHGRIELRGHAALDYFNSHPTVEFNLCKYTAEEFAEALKICNVDEQGTTLPLQAEQKIPEPAPQAAPITIKPAPVPASPPSAEETTEEADVPAMTAEPEPEPFIPEPEPSLPEPAREPPAARMIPPSPPVIPPQPVFGRTPAAPQPDPAPRSPPAPVSLVKPVTPVIPSAPVVLDEAAIKVIGQIKKLNGIVAISVFNETRNIILMGDVEIEPLLKIARNMLATTEKITPLLEWGSFVHMTLQIPEGNVIVAPYHEYHLCLLTTRTINIGHIRRILRDLQISS
jgi:hypothetical protein